MPNDLQARGAQPQKQVRFAPVYTNRFFTGLWTQRNPLRDAATQGWQEKYYGARGDAMIDGLNVEVSNRLTVIRRPGNSVYNSQSFSNVDGFYSFRLFNSNTEQIKVMVDTTPNGGGGVLYDGTGPSTKTTVFTKSAGAGQTFMQSVGNILYFCDGKSSKKWLQSLNVWASGATWDLGGGFPSTYLIDSNGNIEQLTACIIPASTVQITGNVLTFTAASSLTSILSVGLQVTFANFVGAAFLNGQTVTITAVAGSTFTAVFTHANYGPTADTGKGTVVSGGNPQSGTISPTWSATVPSSGNNFQGGTTDDGFARWTNRGTPVQNWGLKGPQESGTTVAPTTSVGSSSTSWQRNTYYSPDGLIIDANGGLQMVLTAGLAGTTVPTWQAANAGLGTTTTDGTVTWLKICNASSADINGLVWGAHRAYTFTRTVGGQTVGTYVKANGCLYKLQQGRGMSCASLKAEYWIGEGVNTEIAGVITGTNATVGASTSGQISVNSLMFNPTLPNLTSPNTQPMTNATINGAGEITATTVPYAPATNGYLMAVYGTITVTAPGPYNFGIKHDDGFILGIDGGATLQNGAQINYTQTITLKQGYPALAGRNVSGDIFDNIIINFPSAGTYNIEIDYASSGAGGGSERQTLSTEIGANIIPTTTFISAGSAPTFPAWTANNAPNRPGVYDASTNTAATFVPGPSSYELRWVNQGPTSDMHWTASTNFHLGGSILDANGNTQYPFRSGISNTAITPTPPTWKTVLNQLTTDNANSNLTWINQGGGTLTAGTLSTFLGGWQYGIALVNTLNNTVSNCGTLTNATGSFINATGITLSAGSGLPDVSNIDPQADMVAIFRTVDGGSTPFLIPGTGNSIYTVPLSTYLTSGYTDTTTDENLNELISAAQSGENTPPRNGAINAAFHLNRLWVSVGDVVYWSSGPDTPVGNGYEGFSPDNFDGVSSVVKRIVPLSVGLFAFTVSDVFVILGDGTPESPILPARPYLQGIGLLSYNALDVNGSIIYMMTSDRHVITFDPSAGVGQIGFPIGNLFSASASFAGRSYNFNPVSSYLTWHVDGSSDAALYVADGSTGWFRMVPTPAPEQGLTWAPFASISGGATAVQSLEVSPGTHKLLVAPASGALLQRDLSTNADNNSTFACEFTIGSLVLAHPGQLAELSFITTEAAAIGTQPTVSVIVNEALPYFTGNFEPLPQFTTDPTEMLASSSIFAQRFYFSQAKQPAICRHLQIKVKWPAENKANELLSMTIFGGYLQEA